MSYFDENVIPGAQVAGQTTQQTTVYGSATAADEQTAIDLAITAARENAYVKFGVNSGDLTIDQTTDSIRIKQNTIFDKNAPNGETYTYTATYGATAYLNIPVVDPAPPLPPDPPPAPPDPVYDGPGIGEGESPPLPSDPVISNPVYDNDPRPDPAKPVIPTPVATMPTVVVTAERNTPQSTLVNPLHEYDSYTYNLSLHLMNIFDFNAVVDDPQHRYVPRNVLIASAGRFQGYARSPAFTEDFYFDNLKISTIIGAGKRNKSSNVVECTFTIIEPNGFTLFNRIVTAAEQVNGKNGNYIKMPYMLQIDFFGIKGGELGQTPIANLTKHIPVTLIGIKSRVSSRGAEYTVSAVAFNHSAFNQTYVRSPADFTVRAKTVSEIFGLGTVDANSTNAATQAQKEELQRQESDLEKQIKTAGEEGVELQKQANSLKSKIASFGPFKINGFTDGINSWYRELKKRGSVSKVNTVRVEFDPEIGLSDIYPSNSPVSVASAASSDNNTAKDDKANIQSNLNNKNQIKFDAGVMTIPAGTSITDLIDWAVRNSKWMERQLYDPTASSSDTKNNNNSNQLKDPLRWVKIIPKIKFSQEGYDPSTNTYTLDITYYVKPWKVNSKLPTGPLGKTPGYVKEYNYIYTGKNRDVIDLQIDFDMLYYQQMTANRNKRKTSMTAPVQGDPEVFYENNGESSSTSSPVSDVQKSGPIVVPQSRVQPIPVSYTSNDVRYTNRMGGNQAASVTGGDLQKNLFKGDMISVKLKILGDPHFIKQDDIFLGQDATTQSGLLTNNGSLWMDNSELYVYVKFKSPIDYNEDIGLAVPTNQSYSESELSGVYRVISVDNEFARGHFVQTLDLARLPLTQEMQFMTTNAQQRTDTAMIVQMSQQGAIASSRFAGPAILQTAVQTAGGTAAGLALTLATNPGAAASMAGSLANKAINSAVSKVENMAMNAVKDFAKPYLDSAKELATSMFDGFKTDLGFAEADFAAGNYGQAFTDVTGIDLGGLGFGDGIEVDLELADEALVAEVGDIGEIADVDVGEVADLGDFFG
jgi:hypothetical protein